MLQLTHDELHKLIDEDLQLKAESDKIHLYPTTDSLEDWFEGKCQMMEIYSRAIKCQKVTDAKNFVEKVFAYIKKHSSSKQEWFSTATSQEHKKALCTIKQEYISQRLCHSPNGNDYICYCNGASNFSTFRI